MRRCKSNLIFFFLQPGRVWSAIKQNKIRIITVNFNQSAVNANACILTLKFEWKSIDGITKEAHMPVCILGYTHKVALTFGLTAENLI